MELTDSHRRPDGRTLREARNPFRILGTLRSVKIQSYAEERSAFLQCACLRGGQLLHRLRRILCRLPARETTDLCDAKNECALDNGGGVRAEVDEGGRESKPEALAFRLWGIIWGLK